MVQEPDMDRLAGRLRTMQIIVVAMLAGAGAALVIMVVWRQNDAPAERPETPLVTYIGLAITVLAIVASILIPNLSTAAARKRIAQGEWQPSSSPSGAPIAMDDAEKLSIVFTTRLIMALPWLEGSTFVLLIAYLLEGQAVSLIVAALLIIGMALQFPTRPRLTAWIREQRRLLGQERPGGA